ncbi:TIM barrel protein [Bacillaceae bacterium SIJ1]|uniref:sugar phosphate isomerase/epimerase family protein n=1 Tax=Litoribacterium kuwaitense TaxID=1398745 RepID=UPI0013EDC813|nr:TIM barrel protein [Litoribacterium kuwaitense]NGP46686.1 TIM barrel protein [Litoribacterium kuwaitense]
MSATFGVSTWSLHRCLGPLHWTVWNDDQKRQETIIEPQAEEVTLLELPSRLVNEGYLYLEICHFHFPDTSEAYLSDLRHAVQASGMILHTLLLDYGDLSTDDDVRRQADINWVKSWIDIAELLGATAVRVVAGEQHPSPASLQRSAEGLATLEVYGREKGVHVVTENFKALTARVEDWKTTVQSITGAKRTIVDFGNLAKEERIKGVEFGSAYAHSFHVKPPELPTGNIDEEELRRMLQAVSSEAPLIVINSFPGNMWNGIAKVKQAVEAQY